MRARTGGGSRAHRSRGRSASPRTSGNFTADFSLAPVTTDPGSGITTTGATLNGTVNANGWVTSGFFRYGTTTGVYSQSTPPQSVGNGATPVSLSGPITGLTPAT